ncbi:MAG: VIT1/CCC1 transporter family protein [Acidimicrobiales bacterium]
MSSASAPGSAPRRAPWRARLVGAWRAESPRRATNGSRAARSLSRLERQPYEHNHRNIGGGAARAAVFGVSDGLVTNVSIVLGVAGAHPGAGVVRLVGLVSLVGGAFSMAAGEYVSMQAQKELLQHEIDVERREINRRPEWERRELARLYESRGVDPVVASDLATEMHRDPEVALATHAREELGIRPEQLGSPIAAAVSSFITFAIGALVPLVAWFVTTGNTALVASVASGIFGAVVVGAGLSVFTGRSWVWSTLRQLGITAVAAAVPYGIGTWAGVSGIG